MQLKCFVALFSLALASTAFAAPVPEPIPALVLLEARSVTPQFSFSGALADIVVPPAGKDKKSIAKNKAKAAKAAEKKKEQQAAAPHVAAVIQAAASTLGLSGVLHVDISNGIHQGFDKLLQGHGTFTFSAPPCNGKCTGHFFVPSKDESPGKGQLGQIFATGGKTIFGENDIA